MTVGIEPVGERAGGATVLPAVLDREATHDLAGILRRARRDGAAVLVATTDRLGEAGVAALRSAFAAAEHPAAAVAVTDLPPLAARVWAGDAVDLLGRADRLGWVHAALPAVARSYTVAAWLARLGGLRSPAPTVGQHALSLLPGIAFGAVVRPTPALRRLRRADALDLPLPDAPHRAVVADAGAPEGWIPAAATGGAPTAVAPSADAARHWGSGRHAELVVAPVLTEARLAALDDGIALRDCPWCDAAVAASPCPCCGMAADGRARVRGVAT